MGKIYGLYLAWTKRERVFLLDDSYPDQDVGVSIDNLSIEYPRELSQVFFYKTPFEQIEAYANIPCPASQCFEADSMDEAQKIIREFNNNFENEDWLKENIYPYT
jgi:hypothetical protein